MSDLFLVTVKKSYSKFLLLRKEKPVDLAKGWRIGDRIEAFVDFLDLGSYLANSLLVFETQIHAKDKVGRYSGSCFFATFETKPNGWKAAWKVVIELSRALIHLAMGLISMFPLSYSNVPGSGFLSELVEPTIFELSSVRL